MNDKEFVFNNDDFDILYTILWEIEEFMCFEDNCQDSIDKLKDMVREIRDMTRENHTTVRDVNFKFIFKIGGEEAEKQGRERYEKIIKGEFDKNE